MILGEIRARAWQVGTVAAGSVAVILAILLTVTVLQRDGARRDRDALHAEIHAPVTGYIARLSMCRANVTVLEAGVRSQNAALEALRHDGATRLAAAERRLAEAQRAAADSRFRVERLLNAPLIATDRCSRVEEADARVLEALR